LEEAIEPFVYEWTRSVSAEHGLGLMKAEFEIKNIGQVNQEEIKKTMDPKGILNPYKVLPETQLD